MLTSHLTALFGVLALAGSASAAPTPRAPSGPLSFKITKAHKSANHRRGLHTRKEGLTNINRDYEYNIELDIGTPSQPYSFILDTGSPDLWVMGDECHTEVCSSQPRFSPAGSSTFKNSNKNFTLGYGSGGVKGYWGEDQVVIDEQHRYPQDIAIVTDVSIELLEMYNTQGLLGLGWQIPNHPKPVWQRILEEPDFTTKGFGIYYERDLGARVDATEVDAPTSAGGEFTIGGYNTDLFTGDLNFIPRIDMNRTFWSIELDGASVNGKEVTKAAKNKVAIDSGSTMTTGPVGAVREIYEQIPGAYNITKQGGGFDWYFPCANMASIDLKFKFGGVEYPIYPGDLSYERTDNGTECRGTIQGGFLLAQLGAPIDWILGANFMKNVYSAFQYDPPAVGFAPLTDAANHRDEKLLGGGSAPVTTTPAATEAPASATDAPATTDALATDAPVAETTATPAETTAAPVETTGSDATPSDASAFKKRGSGPIKLRLGSHQRPSQ